MKKNILLLFLFIFSTSLFANDFYYNQLNSLEQKDYDKIYNAILNNESTVDGVNKDFNKATQIYYYVLDDNPDLYYVSNHINYITKTLDGVIKDASLEITYKDYNSSEKEYIDNKLKEITRDIESNTKGQSKFFIAKYCYDYIINTSFYDKAYSDQSLVSVLINNVGVCSSYAKAYKYLMDYFNIECIVVEGQLKGSSEEHLWNMIKLNNQWYHVDPTQGDASGSYVDYSYFCVDDKQIYKDHILISDANIYKASSNEFYYLYNEGLYFFKIDKDNISNQLLKKVNNKEGEVTFIFDNSIVYNQVLQYLINENGLFKSLIKNGYEIKNLNYYKSDVSNTITFIFDETLKPVNILFLNSFNKSLIKEMITNQVLNKSSINLVFENESDYNRAKEVLINQRYIFDIVEGISSISYTYYDDVYRMDIKTK